MSDEYEKFLALAEVAKAHRRMLTQAIPILQRRIRATAAVIEYLAESSREDAVISQTQPAGFDIEATTDTSLTVELAANA